MVWIEDEMVRLWLGSLLLLDHRDVDSNAMLLEKSGTGWDYHMHHRDSDEMVFIRPVLKHGPRSLTYMRVFGW